MTKEQIRIFFILMTIIFPWALVFGLGYNGLVILKYISDIFLAALGIFTVFSGYYCNNLYYQKSRVAPVFPVVKGNVYDTGEGFLAQFFPQGLYMQANSVGKPVYVPRESYYYYTFFVLFCFAGYVITLYLIRITFWQAIELECEMGGLAVFGFLMYSAIAMLAFIRCEKGSFLITSSYEIWIPAETDEEIKKFFYND